MKFQSLYAKSQRQPATATIPDWPATFEGAFEAIPPEAFTLTVSGLVANPMTLTLAELRALGDGVYEGRLVSADGWTYHSRWDGILLKRLIEKAQPLPEARYLQQRAARAGAAGSGDQDTTEWLELSHVRNSNALLTMGERGQPLSPLYGGPLRLMIFDRYSYKGLGQVISLEFTAEKGASTAISRGYGEDGRITPGDYYAFDQKTTRRVG